MPVTLVSTGIQFPDASIQTTVVQDIGPGQTWQNVAASRAAGTVYTNSTGRPISVSITSIGTAYITVQGVIASRSGIGNATNYLGAVVPPGATYNLNTGAAKPVWAELR